MRCKERCKELNESCPNEECRYYIKYEKELNCSLFSIEKNGPMSLGEIGERLNLSPPRIKQIEDKTIILLEKRIKNDKKLGIL